MLSTWFEITIFPGFIFIIILALLSEQINSRLNSRFFISIEKTPMFIPMIENFKLYLKGEKESTSKKTILQSIILVLMVALPLFASLLLPINLWGTLPSWAGVYGGYPGTNKGVVGVISFEGDLLFLFAIILFFGFLTFLAQYLNKQHFAKESLTKTFTFMIFDIPLLFVLVSAIIAKRSLSLTLLAEDIRRIVNFNLAFGLVFLLPIAISVSLFCLAMKFDQPYFDRINTTGIIRSNAPTPKNWKLNLWNLSMRLMEVVIAGLIVTVFLGGSYLPIPIHGDFQILVNTANFILKCLVVLMITTIIRALRPRMRINQTFNFALKVLTPLSFLSILLTGGYIGLVGLN
ncbi:MAG: NADH-quinone oxidoreductase subunit H [Candidatus Heimdallarchaeota archaeon]|nr:NADH-quinone oxidoreductase subunit H [Candidatus Heimdallarchaeota archaeon]MBY8993558.1 NADH-quinone oxidoreductase subunit H [Candidatus Heimdallarchaeota archaeon]